jgi:hypothetical protein
VLRTWAYVFITTRQPKRVLRSVRKIRGVVHADALFGTPDIVAIVAGENIADMDAVIDRIATLRLIAATDSMVARWIDGVELPFASAEAPKARRRAKG